ncbi:guanylate kinase [Mycobacteroides abscessus]|nr:guanylate kinase [Mycobacteroides abscessus]
MDGVDYHFVTAEEFQRLIDTDALLEWADIHGGLQRSGTRPRPCVRPWRRAARRSSRSIWRCPGDQSRAPAGSRRLSGATELGGAGGSADRPGTESESVIARRLETATVEMAAQTDFDVVIVNDQLENACAKLVSLLVGR